MSILEVGNNEIDNADAIFRFSHYYDCDRVTDTDFHIVNRAMRVFLQGTPYERNYRNSMGIERLLGDLTFEEVGYEALIKARQYRIDAKDYSTATQKEDQCSFLMIPLTYQLYKKFKSLGIECLVDSESTYNNFDDESCVSYSKLILPWHKNITKSHLRYVEICIYQELNAHPRLWIQFKSYWSDMKDRGALWSEESKLGLKPIAV